MNLKDNKFEYNYVDGRVENIKHNGKTLIRVNSDPLTKVVNAIVLPDNRVIQIKQIQRPHYELINGMMLVGAIESSVSEIVLPDGDMIEISYPQPDEVFKGSSIKIDDRVLQWNPRTRHVLSDGDWAYEITPGENVFDNAAIKRINKKGKREFWHNDISKGVEISENLEGVQRIVTKFVSGNLAGKLRKVEERRNGSLEVLQKLDYDDQGNLIRKNGLNVKEEYDEHGRKVKEFIENKLVWERLYNGNDIVKTTSDKGMIMQLQKDDPRFDWTRAAMQSILQCMGPKYGELTIKSITVIKDANSKRPFDRILGSQESGEPLPIFFTFDSLSKASTNFSTKWNKVEP